MMMPGARKFQRTMTKEVGKMKRQLRNMQRHGLGHGGDPVPQAGEYKVERRRLMKRFRAMLTDGAYGLAPPSWPQPRGYSARCCWRWRRQIFWAYLLMGAALPLCRVLES